MKQTAVEWLQEIFYKNEFEDALYIATNQNWFEKAIEMEKQQTIDFANDCIEKWDMTDEILDDNFIEKQYNETFKKK